MREYRVKKLFNNRFASVRDYVVKGCIDNNQELLIRYENKSKLFSVAALTTALQIHKIKFQSKFQKDLTYELIDFDFTPSVKSNPFW